jgi:hypothetical protein
MNAISSETSPSSLLSMDEISKANQYLNSTRDDLLHAVNCLDDAQWNFKPAPDRWSIAETLEHVVMVENAVHGIVGRMADSPAGEPGRIHSQIDDVVLTEVPRRSPKFQAPPQIAPTLQWSPAETLQRFEEGRTRTLHLLAHAPFLRGRVVPHPILGPWDGYQWILAAGAHCARHTDQILEVKSSAGFPDM